MKQHLDTLWSLLAQTPMACWQQELEPLINQALHPQSHGDLDRWMSALQAIQNCAPAQRVKLNQAVIEAKDGTLSGEQQFELEQALRQLMPWRKGPYDLQGVFIDTEWHSDWKWDRVRPHLAPLQGRKILDVGCGSGYHLWRMTAEEAELVIGIDPSLLFMVQFLAVRHFVGDSATFFIPLPLEALPVCKQGGGFDSVFSMGVLYHRRSPFDHLYELKQQLRSGGELILETLVIPEDYGQILVPQDRYAQMRNVWFLPSVKELMHWLERCGFINVRCVDLDQTSIEEQRTTDWMRWNSLVDFLDPQDHNKTSEGYPAPLRAVVLANKA